MELMQMLHNSLHCSQCVLQCASGSAWKAVVVQVTFDLLIFDLEHRISIMAFMQIFIFNLWVSKDESYLWSQDVRDTLKPLHIQYRIYYISTTFSFGINAHNTSPLTTTPLEPTCPCTGTPSWLSFKALVIT